MKKRITCRTLFFTFLFAGFAGFARDTLTCKLPRITITANRYEKDSFETHLQVNLLHESGSWSQGQSNFGEWIASIPGVSLSETGPWSHKPVIRGLSEAHILTLVDGMKLDVLRNYGNHAPLVDIDQIERIEVIRGPGSVLYGSNAVAGVVNIITKSPKKTSHQYAINSRIGLQYASVNRQWSEMMMLQGRYGKYNMLLNITHRKADDINTPAGRLKNTAFSGYTSDLKLVFQPSVNQQLLFSGHLTRMNDVGVPINPKARTAHFKMYNRDRITLSYKYQRPDQFISDISMDLYYQQGEREFDALLYHIPKKGANFVNNHLNAHRDVKTWGGSLQTGWRLSGANLLTAGVDCFTERDNTRRLSDSVIVNAEDQMQMDPPADLTPPTPLSNREGLAAFLEDEWYIASWISLNAGMRYDAIFSEAEGTPGTLTELNRNETDRDYSGNIGVVIRLGNQIRLTGNIGRAFKAPTLQERFFKGTAQVGYLYGNPNLNSETSINLDAGFRLKSDCFQISLNMFHNRIHEFIVMKPVSAGADTFLYDNVGCADLYGIEWNGRFQLIDALTLFANSAYVGGQDRELNENLPKIPPLNSLMGITFGNEMQNYWLTFAGEFHDRQQYSAKNESQTDGYILFDICSGLKISRLLSLKSPIYITLNIRNVFNESYRDHLSNVTWWNAPGRNIIFGIRGNF
ncbi:TonB-dependent receptor [bacterium]|nr:TonB-dependent receptor [bacterium]